MQVADDRLSEAVGARLRSQSYRQALRTIDSVRAGVWTVLAVAVPLAWVAIAKALTAIF
jgi:hypothetical protein